jgi:hypothetical protein
MAYGKIKADSLVHDNGGSDVEVTIASLAAKAGLASPTFTGTPAAPTAAQGTSTTQIATTAFVNAEIAADTANKVNTSDIGSTVQAYDVDTAKTDVAQTFTQGQRGGITVLSSTSGVTNIDFVSSNNFNLTLTENITSITVQNAVAGQSGSIFFTQPSSGGPYTVGGWNSAFKFSGGVAPTITAVNSKTDRVDYVIKSSTEIQVVWTGNY